MEDHRRGDVNGGIDADHDPPEHGEGEVANHRATKRDQRDQSQERRDRGHDGARKRLVERAIDQLGQRHGLVAAQVLADPIIDDDRIVDRVADDREHRRDRGEIELEPEQREQAERGHGIMDQRHDGPDRELPFEAEPDVGEDGEQGVDGRLRAGPEQILTDLRADELDPPVADVVAEALGERGLDLARLQRAALPRRPPGARPGSGRATGSPNSWSAISPRPRSPSVERIAARSARTRHADLDQDAALEIDPEVETLGRHQDQGEQDQGAREGVRPVAIADERDPGVVRDQAETAHGFVRTGGCFCPLAAGIRAPEPIDELGAIVAAKSRSACRARPPGSGAA